MNLGEVIEVEVEVEKVNGCWMNKWMVWVLNDEWWMSGKDEDGMNEWWDIWMDG